MDETPLKHGMLIQAACYGLIGIMTASLAFMLYIMWKTRLISFRMVLPAGLAAVLLDGVLSIWLLERKQKTMLRWLSAVTVLALSVVCTSGSLILERKPAVFGIEEKPLQYALVLASRQGNVSSIEHLEGQKIGYLKNISRWSTDQAVEALKQSLSSFSLQSYGSFAQLRNACFSGEVQAAIIHQQYESQLMSQEAAQEESEFISLLAVEVHP